MKVIFYLIVFSASRTRFIIPHFILFPLFAFPSGAVDKLVLPEGMQSVNFYNGTGLTGMAKSQGRVRFIFI